jgi:hypothetical protein
MLPKVLGRNTRCHQRVGGKESDFSYGNVKRPSPTSAYRQKQSENGTQLSFRSVMVNNHSATHVYERHERAEMLNQRLAEKVFAIVFEH